MQPFNATQFIVCITCHCSSIALWDEYPVGVRVPFGVSLHDLQMNCSTDTLLSCHLAWCPHAASDTSGDTAAAGSLAYQ